MAVAVLGGTLSKAQAAGLYGVSPKIVSRWSERFKASGRAAMVDRSSRPQTSPRQTDQALVARTVNLRRQRLTGKHIARACKALGLKHIRTKPYTPKTNCKAERFIQTALREWAYAQAYPSSEHRKAHLLNWTHMYNRHRRHGTCPAEHDV